MKRFINNTYFEPELITDTFDISSIYEKSFNEKLDESILKLDDLYNKVCTLKGEILYIQRDLVNLKLQGDNFRLDNDFENLMKMEEAILNMDGITSMQREVMFETLYDSFGDKTR